MERICRRAGRGWVGLTVALLAVGGGVPAPLGPRLSAAQPIAVGASAKALTEALRDDSATSLRLTWTLGPGQRLEIDAGSAALLRCGDGEPSACTAVGTTLSLSAGERAQLVSRLRASELAGLHSSEAAQESDRALGLSSGARALGSWRLPRADWPTPPDGYGLPDYLDDLGRRIKQASEARKPVAVPRTVDELRALRVQVKLEPRRRPGGLLVIEGGTLRLQPQEGFVPRSPAPRPTGRPLLPAEEQQLLLQLQAAQLETLEAQVEKRAEPAIGDDDGRLLTLHLMPAEHSPAALGQPRGLQRYVADLRRSPAAPLVDLLVSWLTAAPALPEPAKASHRSPSRRKLD
jgi:hypothetical protein